ncbi:hypothetical protein J7E49_24730 [Variovorax paradoxus]|nr:hypothetical protein [Variovorax paradoxus]
MNEASSMIVFGNWRVRHAEPSPEAARRLRVQRVAVRSGARAAQVDCRGAHVLVAHCVDETWQPYPDASTPVTGCNIDPDWVPLAHVDIDDGLMHIRHLIDRADRHVAHFIAPPVPVPPFAPPLLYEQLWQAFQANHLQTSNYECYYAVHAAPEELHVAIDSTAPLDVLALGDAWLDELGADIASHFVAQIGDELQHGSHDNVLCQVLPHLEGGCGWANAAIFSRKRRATVLEPLAEFSVVLRQDNCMPWTEQRHPDQRYGTAVEVDLAQHLDLPLRPVVRWRHTRASSGCESLETGNLFSVGFSCAQAAAPVFWCAIGYLRTRGDGSAALVAQEQAALRDKVLQFLRRQGLDAQTASGGIAILYERIAEGSLRP